MLLSDMISRLERRHMGAYLEMLDIAMLLRCSISHLPRFEVLSSYKKSLAGTGKARSNIPITCF